MTDAGWKALEGHSLADLIKVSKEKNKEKAAWAMSLIRKAADLGLTEAQQHISAIDGYRHWAKGAGVEDMSQNDINEQFQFELVQSADETREKELETYRHQFETGERVAPGSEEDALLSAGVAREIAHWATVLGAGMLAQFFLRLGRSFFYPSANISPSLMQSVMDALRGRDLLRDVAAVSGAHVATRAVQHRFPTSDWPGILFQPSLSAVLIGSAHQGDVSAALIGALTSVLTARPSVDDWREGIEEAKKARFFSRIKNPAVDDDVHYAEEDILAHNQSIEAIARSKLAEEYIEYDEYIRMPGYGLLNITVAEQWTDHAASNRGGSKMIFLSLAAVEGYAKAYGYVAYSIQEDPASGKYIIVQFFDSNSWNRWAKDYPKLSDRLQKTLYTKNCTVGIHPALYNKEFEQGHPMLIEMAGRTPQSSGA